MAKLLLVIDYQDDFVADDGKLTVGRPAQLIEPAILQRVDAYENAGDDVICTLDTHSAQAWQNGHPEAASFPLHCAEGTPGWALYGELVNRNLETLTKSSYMLDVADLDWLVRAYDEIELAGVATDICVLQNAIGLYNHAANRSIEVRFRICPACVASFDAANHQWALNFLKSVLGFTIVDSPDEAV
jgi:nicotinamidase-related amidase